MADENTSGDWAAQAVDRIDDMVGLVRDKAVVPLTTAARAVVYGVLALFIGVVVLILVAIFAVRIINVYLPGGVWEAYALVGGIFTLVGLFFWSRRSPRASS